MFPRLALHRGGQVELQGALWSESARLTMNEGMGMHG